MTNNKGLKSHNMGHNIVIIFITCHHNLGLTFMMSSHTESLCRSWTASFVFL